MKILIVEDEAIISENIYQQIRITNLYSLLEPVDSVEKAKEKIQQEKPRLLLLDLHLGDGYGGIEIAKYIRDNNLDIEFIVISAYSDSEIVSKIKKFQPLSFLVKPFSRESLLVALQLVSENINRTDQDNAYLTVKTGNKREKVAVNLIEYIKASEKYIELYMSNHQKKLIRSSLVLFLNDYPATSFVRVHKSFLVNSDYVEFYGDNEIQMKSGSKIPVGKVYISEVKSMFYIK